MPEIETPTAEPVVETPSPEADKPRDEHGRFTKPAGAEPKFTFEESDEEEKAPETEEAKPEEEVVAEAAKEDEAPNPEPQPNGLGLDDEDAPVFEHDGRFVGGKFLGKYETLDDAMVGLRNAQKRIGQLEHQLSQAESGTPDVPQYLLDPHALTPDRMAEIVAKEIGFGDEMTAEQYAAFDKNPGMFIANALVKGNAAMEKVRTERNAWREKVRSSYASVEALRESFDPVIKEGEALLQLYQSGKEKNFGIAQLCYWIGYGAMATQAAKQAANSGKKATATPKTETRVPSRNVETRANRPAPKVPKTGPTEDEKFLADCQTAAYG
jgi:hypothetical protein